MNSNTESGRDAEIPPHEEGTLLDWKWQLRNSIKNPDKVKEKLNLNDVELNQMKDVVKRYPFRVTPYYLSLVKADDRNDPIFLQSMPAKEENQLYFDVQEDPLGEEHDTVLPGLIHRYPDRVLLTLTNICPVYCRHCTRKRNWKNGEWIRTSKEMDDIYSYIRSDKRIRDVIISGGDPFILCTSKLENILKNIRHVPHVEIIRIGTRCPVVLPQRIDDELVSMLKKYRPIWLNTHFNHPREITLQSRGACDKLICAGIPVNNQSVLLKGINDNVDTMTELCQKLLAIGVRPYYLFQCDPVSGTGHFRTSIFMGLDIIKGMRGFTSGLAVPTFVVDGLEGQGKVPLQPPDYMLSLDYNHAVLKGYKGDVFRYYNPGSGMPAPIQDESNKIK